MVTVIRDLKVKGSYPVVKRAAKIENIRRVGAAGLKSEFVKKV
jgi:uncharacterized Zn ribbon protein